MIIGPWNYPLQLVILPLVGAIAAGNCVVIKPSEISSHVSNWLFTNLNQYLDSKRIIVIEGGIEETNRLLQQKWDYIFYTGNLNVGKIVMKAASEFLTPLTLELGGKCPVIVSSDVDMNLVCKRVALGKFMNMGQTCVSPDHIFVPHEKLDQFIEEMKNTLIEFFGSNPQNSKDLSRIINKYDFLQFFILTIFQRNHLFRLKSLISQHKNSIVLGGQFDEDDLYLAPTLILEPNINSSLVSDEIFGPILPIFTYKEDIKPVISQINEKGQPLSIYIFCKDLKFADYIINHTRSGSVSINETVVQATCRDLPFGGGKFYLFFAHFLT